MRRAERKAILWDVVVLIAAGACGWLGHGICDHYTDASVDAPTRVEVTDENRTGFWLNTASDTRHNSSCRYYRNTSAGRPCRADEGQPCRLCGG